MDIKVNYFYRMLPMTIEGLIKYKRNSEDI